jgi:hypothetical protein
MKAKFALRSSDMPHPWCRVGFTFVAVGFIVASSVDAAVIANSSTEFSGLQGQNGWTYGYRDLSAADASENYDPDADFIPFAGGPNHADWNGTTQQWTGTTWKAADGSELTGTGSTPGAATGWTVRRWLAVELSEKTPVQLKWTLAKADKSCGNGVTGALFINGQLADKTTIAFDRATTVTRNFFALLCPDDRVDLVLRSLGTDGTDDAQCDGSVMSLIVNTTCPADPKQPNGKSFLQNLVTPKLSILSQTRSAMGDPETLRWRSLAAATYGIDASDDLVHWSRIKTGLPGTACQPTQSQTVDNPTASQRFYRVVQESKTLEGLWVGYYDNCCYALVRVRLNGDQAVATWEISPIPGYDGRVDWQADVPSGVGTGLTSEGFVSGQLRILAPDRITFSKAGLGSANQYRRVD